MFLKLNSYFKYSAGCRVRTCEDIYPMELESTALDHSAKPAFKIERKMILLQIIYFI